MIGGTTSSARASGAANGSSGGTESSIQGPPPLGQFRFPQFDEFADDVHDKLGRANGNVYHRKPGLEGVHDGQVMVRLKKKRFVVLDYGIEPQDSDYLYAQSVPHIKILDGAGRRKCTMANCTKIGVPVCLWDSEPDEVDSLYLRSGLCFTCQRNLNEKRRTERKRPASQAWLGDSSGSAGRFGGGYQDAVGDFAISHAPSLIYAIGPTAKRIVFQSGPSAAGGAGAHQAPLLLRHDAVIISPPPGMIDGLLGLHDVSGAELQALARDAVADVDRLVAAAAYRGTDGRGTGDAEGVGPGASEGAASATTASTQPMSAEAAASSVHIMDPTENETVGEGGGSSIHPSVQDLYEVAFKSLNKTILLLHHWKTSWDAAIDAVASDDSHFADALASAAAVAAAAGAAVETEADGVGVPAADGLGTGSNSAAAVAAVAAAAAAASVGGAPAGQGGSNMVSLLLAADDAAVDGKYVRYVGGSSGAGGRDDDPLHVQQMMDVDDVQEV